jgi:hypothetical protein
MLANLVIIAVVAGLLTTTWYGLGAEKGYRL